MLRHLGIRSAPSPDDDGCDLLRHNRDGQTSAAPGGSMSSEDDEFLADCQPPAHSVTASSASGRSDDSLIDDAPEGIELELRGESSGKGGFVTIGTDEDENEGMAMDELPLREARNTRLRVGTSAEAHSSDSTSATAGPAVDANAGSTAPTSRHVVFILCCLQALLSVSSGQAVTTLPTHPSRCLTTTAHRHHTTTHLTPVV
jgi:hypothetical protein